MLPDDFKITTEMLSQAGLLFALLDAVYVPVLVWRIKPEVFRGGCLFRPPVREKPPVHGV